MIVGLALLGVAAVSAVSTIAYRASMRVGDRTDRGILVASGQWINPQGRMSILSTRPNDLVLSSDGKTAYLKENEGLTIVDCVSGDIRQRLAIPGGASLTGLALSADGQRLYFSDADDKIAVIDVGASPAKVESYIKLPPAKVGGSPYPCGLALDGQTLYAALSRANEVAVIDLATGTVTRTFAVEPAPFGLALDAAHHQLWVTSWGTTPKSGEHQSLASGTLVAVDRRGIAIGGAVTPIDLEANEAGAPIRVGSQPCEIALHGDAVFVAEANSDDVIRVDRVTHAVKVTYQSSLNGEPSSLCLMPNGDLAVACGGTNEIVVLGAADSQPVATYRAAWYPAAVRTSQGNLYVASAKGLGERRLDLRGGVLDTLGKTEKSAPLDPAEKAKGFNSYQFTGVLSVIPAATVSARSEELPASASARPDVRPIPVPERVGEPSVFKHVVYVLKENRTYDQVFGDIGKGDSDPSLCIYGEEITPNQHALAREFALLDNYYCNGVLSADGHSWSTEGNATTYFARSFGGWTRSYPFGDDPLAISNTGHIWDAVLDKGLTFRNYGEYDTATPTKGEKYLTILKDFESGERKVKFSHQMGIDRLRAHSDPDCPGWNLDIPDVLRSSYFIRDVEKANLTGNFPALNFVYLPQDHTSGGGAGAPAPTAQVADNDLAVGRVVDAVSHSKFWKDTVIFVVEDDPQAGFDHVDGHRSLCLVISPYTRRGAVVSDFYTQAGVLTTISHILGLKPATRFEQIANLMTNCFQSSSDLRPYTAKPNRVPIDALNPSKTAFRSLNLSKPDQVNEDEFNRQLWALAKGSTPYPAEWAGPHGRGLEAKGLRAQAGSESPEKDDDDE